MSRIFIDKFHHCWLLKCSKSWTKKKCSPKRPSYKRAKKRNTYTVWLPFDFDIFYCFVLCLHSAVPVAFDWLLNNGFRKYYWLVQKYLWDRSKIEHKKNSPCCMPVWLVLVHVQRALVGSRCWNHNVFAPFFSLFEQKPTIIRFNGENVRKWTLIHCSRRSMWLFCCCCCFRCYVHRAFMYMSCSHLSCDDADYRSCSFFFTFCAVCDSVQHKVSNWTNALIYCDPFGLSLEYSIAIVTLQIFGVKIFPSFFSPPFDAFVFCSVIFVSHFVSHL